MTPTFIDVQLSVNISPKLSGLIDGEVFWLQLQLSLQYPKIAFWNFTSKPTDLLIPEHTLYWTAESENHLLSKSIGNQKPVAAPIKESPTGGTCGFRKSSPSKPWGRAIRQDRIYCRSFPRVWSTGCGAGHHCRLCRRTPHHLQPQWRRWRAVQLGGWAGVAIVLMARGKKRAVGMGGGETNP